MYIRVYIEAQLYAIFFNLLVKQSRHLYNIEILIPRLRYKNRYRDHHKKKCRANCLFPPPDKTKFLSMVIKDREKSSLSIREMHKTVDVSLAFQF